MLVTHRKITLGDFTATRKMLIQTINSRTGVSKVSGQ